MVLIMPVTSLKGRLIFVFFLYSNVVKSYKEVETRELIYLNNPLLYLYNK